jgi:hypothetical protein
MDELQGFKNRMKGKLIIGAIIVCIFALISLINYIINLLN